MNFKLTCLQNICLDSGKFKFYYGYEVEDPSTEEWCFQVKKDGNEVFRIITSKIEESTNFF